MNQALFAHARGPTEDLCSQDIREMKSFS